MIWISRTTWHSGKTEVAYHSLIAYHSRVIKDLLNVQRPKIFLILLYSMAHMAIKTAFLMYRQMAN